MRKAIAIPEDLFIRHGQEIEALFQQAVRRALWRHKRLGNPVAAWEDGQVVIVQPEEIEIDESLLAESRQKLKR
jgi:hypothetical protein